MYFATTIFLIWENINTARYTILQYLKPRDFEDPKQLYRKGNDKITKSIYGQLGKYGMSLVRISFDTFQ